MKHGFFFLALALAGGGCVSAGKFQAEQRRAQALSTRLQEAGRELEEVRSAKQQAAEAAQRAEGELRAQMEAAKGRILSLEKSSQDLQASMKSGKDELSRKLSEVVKEKDAAAKRSAELRAELSGAQASLKSKEAEIAKALEEKQALERAKQEELERVKGSYEELAAKLKSEVAAGEVTITQLKNKLTVNMLDRILFDSGQAEVKPAGHKVLDKVADVLRGVRDKDIRIEGHTDNVPIGAELRAKYPTNWELSTTRATAVARYLQDRAGIEPKRLVAAGYGEHRPISPNDTPANRASNRRIEIVLVPQD